MFGGQMCLDGGARVRTLSSRLFAGMVVLIALSMFAGNMLWQVAVQHVPLREAVVSASVAGGSGAIGGYLGYRLWRAGSAPPQGP